MDIDGNDKAGQLILIRLATEDWLSLRNEVADAGIWLRAAPSSNPLVEEIGYRFLALAEHPKWEVRKELVHASEPGRHSCFDSVLATLSQDENGLVRDAAKQSLRRRRIREQTDTLRSGHAELVRKLLDDIEIRHGTRARDAVDRAADQLTNAFVREAYHEIVKIISPMQLRLDRLMNALGAEPVDSQAAAREHVVRLTERLAHLEAVLRSLRTFTAPVELAFRVENLAATILDAVELVRERVSSKNMALTVQFHVNAEIEIQIDRNRIIQAFSNILHNAVESYDGLNVPPEIKVLAVNEPGARVSIHFIDSGCGMSSEDIAGATKLFTTSKGDSGTGFGLPLAVKVVQSEHGGSLEIRSTEGEGTTVVVILPVQQVGAQL